MTLEEMIKMLDGPASEVFSWTQESGAAGKELKGAALLKSFESNSKNKEKAA